MINPLISPIAPRMALSSLDHDIQWNLIDVGVEKAWNYTQGRSKIVVAVIDSGIDFSHPDLVNQSWRNSDEIPNNGIDDDGNNYIDDIVGWDFRDNDNNPSPGHRHGTFVAGLIAADDDNHISVGIAPNIKLMAIRFLDDQLEFGGDDWDMFIEAIDYTVNNGANIIQLSIQAYGVPPESFHEAIKRAYNSGVVVVSVTGNNENDVTYPGKYSEVIAVSATNKSRHIAEFSSPGEENEICAPGEDVYSIYPNKWTPQTGSGTSFAAPLVAGAIALMLSLNNTLGIETIRSILHETCTDLGTSGKDPIFGYGLLNVSAALEKVVDEYNNGTTIIPIETSSNNMTTTSSNGTAINEIYGVLALIILCCKRKMKKPTK
ncbi:MAG: S8 family serine peptidase [Candidatus Thorarchaeota archaeon]